MPRDRPVLINPPPESRFDRSCRPSLQFRRTVRPRPDEVVTPTTAQPPSTPPHVAGHCHERSSTLLALTLNWRLTRCPVLGISHGLIIPWWGCRVNDVLFCCR